MADKNENLFYMVIHPQYCKQLSYTFLKDIGSVLCVTQTLHSYINCFFNCVTYEVGRVFLNSGLK